MSAKSRKYDIEEESEKLYKEDVRTVLVRFRRTHDYLKIMEDKAADINYEFHDMSMQLLFHYTNELTNKVADVVGYKPEDEKKHKKTTTPISMDEVNTPAPINISISMRRAVKKKKDSAKRIQKLEQYRKFYSSLSLRERNDFRNLGYGTAGKIIQQIIRNMQYEGGLGKSTYIIPHDDDDSEWTTATTRRTSAHTTTRPHDVSSTHNIMETALPEEPLTTVEPELVETTGGTPVYRGRNEIEEHTNYGRKGNFKNDERLKKQRAEREKAAMEKSKREEAEKENIKLEKARIEELRQAEQEKVEQERARVKAEQEKVEQERARVKAEQEKVEQERARVKAEQEKVEQERARVKAEQEKVEQERARAKAEQEKVEQERARAKAELEKAEKEAEKAKADKKKAERQKLEKEKAEREKSEKEKAAREKAELDKNEQGTANEVKAIKDIIDQEQKDQEKFVKTDKALTEQELKGGLNKPEKEKTEKQLSRRRARLRRAAERRRRRMYTFY